MKRLIPFVIFFVFSIFSLNAQSLSAEFLFDFPHIKDFSNQSCGAEMGLNFDYQDVSAKAAVKLDSLQTQFTATATYMPEIGKRNYLGGGLRYHFVDYNNIFHENYILPSIRYGYITKKGLHFEFAYAPEFIFSTVNSVKSEVPYIYNWCNSFEILLSKSFNDEITGFFSFSTFDDFEYPLFGTPFFKTGIEYNITDNLTLVSDYTIVLIDMFMSTTYVSGSYLRAGAKVTIW